MPETAQHISQCHIKLDGQDAGADVVRDLLEVSVESSLHLPDAATITLHDQQLHWTDSQQFDPGKKLTVTMIVEGTSHAIFDGEIVELEPCFADFTKKLVIRAFDRLHRLARGRYIRSFIQMTDADIISKIAGEAGLSPQVGPASGVYPHLFQHNQTNLEFVQQRAAALGYLLYVEGSTLHCQPARGDGAPLALEWGKQLNEFRPRLTTIDQIDGVTARGWDPKAKRAVVGEASHGEGAPKIGESRSGAELANTAFGSAKTFLTNEPARTQERAQQLAQGEVNRRSGRAVEADGVCGGEPRLLAGVVVNISGVGTRFGGNYLVTGATHVYGFDGYHTQFSVSGQEAATLLGLLAPATTGQTVRGLLIGLVTNNQDPDGQGRVKLKYPTFSDDVESDWARLVMPGAGAARGCEFLPEVNDEVLVGFELGDINHPYVLGGLWNGQDAPPKPSGDLVTGGKVQQRIIQSRAGHVITLDDSDSGGSVSIVDKNGNKIVLDSQQNALTIEVKGNAEIKAQGNLSLEAQGNLSLQAQGQLEAKGLSAKLEGQTTTDIKGGMINLN